MRATGQGAMRLHLPFPRGPSPRIFFYVSDRPGLAWRDLALAAALTAEFETGSVVLATAAVEVVAAPGLARVAVVKVPSLASGPPGRPLARERVRRQRQKLLNTLFDAFKPDLLLLDVHGPEAEQEARSLLARARALGSATLVGVSHDRPGEGCYAPDHRRGPSACERCRDRTCRSAREALQAGPRLRGNPAG